jgi:outer membrane protein
MKKILLLLVVLVSLGEIAMSQTIIVHVHSQVLWDTLPSAKIALEQYAQAEKDAYDELTRIQSEFEAAVKKYESEKEDMIPTVREFEEKKLMAMQERIESTNQSLKDYLINTSNELNAPLQDRIKRAVDFVAERNNISYVIDATTAIYSAGGQDITNEVIVELLRLDRIEQRN